MADSAVHLFWAICVFGLIISPGLFKYTNRSGKMDLLL